MTAPLDLETLRSGFRALGLGPGDAALVHSAYKSFGGVVGGPQTVLEALLATLDCAGAGTLLLPTYNFQFCQSGWFDVARTPSKMGILTEVARVAPGACRTRHPTHSVAVLGPDGPSLGATRCDSAFGPDSPFAWLTARDGWIVVIGLDYNSSMTYFHHVEEIEGVSYRYSKTFRGTVKHVDGSEETGAWSLGVRDWDRGVITSVNPMGALLEAEGAVTIRQIGQATVRAMRAREVYRLTKDYLPSARGLLYRVGSPEEAKAT